MWTSSLSMCSDSVSGMCLSWARGCKLIFCHSLILDCQSISGSGTIYNKIVSGRQSSCQPLPAGHSPEDKELESSMVGAQNPIRASSKTLKCWNNSAPAWIKNYPYECHRSVTDFQARSDRDVLSVWLLPWFNHTTSFCIKFRVPKWACSETLKWRTEGLHF